VILNQVLKEHFSEEKKTNKQNKDKIKKLMMNKIIKINSKKEAIIKIKMRVEKNILINKVMKDNKLKEIKKNKDFTKETKEIPT